MPRQRLSCPHAPGQFGRGGPEEARWKKHDFPLRPLWQFFQEWADAEHWRAFEAYREQVWFPYPVVTEMPGFPAYNVPFSWLGGLSSWHQPHNTNCNWPAACRGWARKPLSKF